MKRNEEYLLPGTLFLLRGIALFMKYIALKNIVVDGGGMGKLRWNKVENYICFNDFTGTTLFNSIYN